MVDDIEKDDPYLVTFAPRCAPWSSWQHVNLSKGGGTEEAIIEEQGKWIPTICWICSRMKERLRRGRHGLVESPGAVWEMEKLLNDTPTVENFTRRERAWPQLPPQRAMRPRSLPRAP